MFTAGTQSSQGQNNSTIKEEPDAKAAPSQTIFNNVGTQNNIYINAPNPATNKINLPKDNVD